MTSIAVAVEITGAIASQWCWEAAEFEEAR